MTQAQLLHGGDVYAVAQQLGVAATDILDFSNNSFIQACDITHSLLAPLQYPFEHYPDVTSKELRATLSEHEYISPASIIIGNGSSELIWLTLLTLQPKHVLCIGPLFSEYIRACQGLDIHYTLLHNPANPSQLHWLPTQKDLPAQEYDLIILCSPNNPSGFTLNTIEQLQSLCTAVAAFGKIPQLLLDGTYRDFLDNKPEAKLHTWNELNKYFASNQLIFMHSFTKFYACSGLRLGYLLGNPQLIDAMHYKRASWMVNPFAEKVGTLLLNNKQRYQERLTLLEADLIYLVNSLNKLTLFNQQRLFTGTNFATIALNPTQSPSLSSTELRLALLKHKILIRDCNSIPGMPTDFVRIQARPQQDTDTLITALNTITQKL